MFDQTRRRRPYQQKVINKKSALLFGCGFGALLMMLVILASLMLPYASSKLDSLSYRARTYYRKLMPHPEYLPTPAPAVSNPAPSRPAVVLPPTSTRTPTAKPATPTPSPAPTAGGTEPGDPPESVQEVAVAVPAETVELAPVGSQVQLTGLTHQWQTWNNCGPATITTYLSYYGYTGTQADAALFLKPNRDDKNVSPEQLVAYTAAQGSPVIMRLGGNIEQLKQFLSSGIPVLAETWLVHDGDGLGHYRLVTGFDDNSGQLYTMDSLNGPDYTVSYEQFDNDWRVFNRLYIVAYQPEQAATVQAIIGPALDDTVMYEQLVAEAQADIAANPQDAIAYFNQGEALTRLGRFQEAVEAFDQARQLGLHWRRLWYQFTPFEAYYAAGRYQDVYDLANATVKSSGGLEEAYYYRGLALLALGQAGAADDFEAAIAYNPNFTPAAEALTTLTNQN